MEEHHDTQQYKVVLNDEAQYSIWLTDRPLPAGWREDRMFGTKSECLAYIERAWTDMQPLSVRRQLDG